MKIMKIMKNMKIMTATESNGAQASPKMSTESLASVYALNGF